LLHASNADKVWPALARVNLDAAVFAAFKAVEESEEPVLKKGLRGDAAFARPTSTDSAKKPALPASSEAPPTTSLNRIREDICLP